MHSLAHTKILVTRPAHQAKNLCQLIQAHGGEAVLLPALAIVPIENNQALQDCVSQIDDLDILIFISTNAVTYTLPALLACGNLPAHLIVAAVGEKTAQALKQRGISPLCPTTSFNSEALLALPHLQMVKGKNIAIFRGEGGRELLATTLQQRGATVRYVNVYHRIQPPTPVWLIQQSVDIITVTSVQILHNLFNMLAEQSWFKQTPFVVMSERVRIEAKQLGIRVPIAVAPFASDEGLLQAILQLCT